MQAALILFNPLTADYADYADGFIRVISAIRGQKVWLNYFGCSCAAPVIRGQKFPMKNSILPPSVARAAMCVTVLLALGLTSVCVLRAADKSSPANLARDLIGTWVNVGEPGKIVEAPAKGGFIKHRTAHHWAAIAVDPQTGLVEAAHGGTWRVNGNEYEETVEYGSEIHAALMNKTFKWKVTLEGDVMTKIPADNNPWKEVWKRVK